MRGLRFVIAAVSVLLFLLLTPLTAYGEDAAADEELSKIRDSINRRLADAADGEDDILGDLELDVGSDDAAGGLTFGGIVGKLFELIFGSLGSPAKMLGKLIAAAVLCSLAQSLCSGHMEMQNVSRMTGALAAVLAVYESLSNCISVTVDCLNRLIVFMVSYIPIYAGVTSASGGTAVGTSFYGTNLFLCECTAFAARSLISPLLSILTAFSVVGAINPDIKLGCTAEAVRKATLWLLGITMTVFTGFLTIQSAVGSAADSAKSRVVRFAASSFIPVIGGSVSETYSVLKGSFSLIRAGTGSVGVILMAVIVLRPLAVLIAARIVLFLGRLFCDILGQQDMSQLVTNIGSIVAIAMSITVCISLMFIISTCIIMMTSSGVGV
ncbi:MAG: stage III sporulation protein AE [Ruminococcus sp.]|nr:stage III sporulation protein AE [Ruminococcus sp.]